MKAVNLLINSVLPEDLHDEARVYDKKGVGRLMADLAERHPDRYNELAKFLSDTGRQASYLQGETLTLQDMKPPFDKAPYFKKMDQELALMNSTTKNSFERKRKRLEIYTKYNDLFQELTMKHSRGRNLMNIVASGARGNPSQMKMMITTPGMFSDYRDQPVDLFVRNSYGEGLRPAEYLASMFGARKAVIATKGATAQAGDLGKQMTQAATRQVVTVDDCGTSNGVVMTVDEDETDLQGRVLARNVGKLPAGTVVDRHVLTDLKKQKGDKPILIRSPLTCSAQEGVCIHCSGTNTDGKLPTIGDAVGVTATAAMAEPIAQGSLNCLVEGTRVRMADFSTREIQDLTPGDMVLGSDTIGRTFPTAVTHVWDQGQQPVAEYVFKRGATRATLSVEATEIHEILANTKKTNCKEGSLNHVTRKLAIGYKAHDFGAVLPAEYIGTGGLSEPLALLLGLLAGDGCHTAGVKHAILLSCADETLITDIRPYLQGLGLKINKTQSSYDWRIAMIDDVLGNHRDDGGKVIEGYRHPVRKYMDEHQLLDKYAHEKQLPDISTSWDTQSLADYIGGLISADGSLYFNRDGHPGISLSLASKALLSQVKLILEQRFCIYPTEITCINKAGSGNRNHDQWQFTITKGREVFAFCERIPLVGVKRTLVPNIKVATKVRDEFYRCPRKEVIPKGKKHCWDISVEHEDSLFVLENGLIVKNTKHSGGAVAGGKRTFSGFAIIDRLLQSPGTFPDRASVSELHGAVSDIREAPQGGMYITVKGPEDAKEDHYVLPGFDPVVQVGDEVEAGDQLSDGLIDIEDIVRLRGLGEGRRYYVKRLQQAYKDSGMNVTKRNLEFLARAHLDQVQIKDDQGLAGYLPDEVVSYNSLINEYQPPKDAELVMPGKAKGRYLEQPILHFTIGTKLTPNMLKEIKGAGVPQVLVSDANPRFSAGEGEQSMIQLRRATKHHTDWLAKQHTSHISETLRNDALAGADTNIESNVHFAPRMAVGVGFGDKVRETGRF